MNHATIFTTEHYIVDNNVLLHNRLRKEGIVTNTENDVELIEAIKEVGTGGLEKKGSKTINSTAEKVQQEIS